MKKKLIIFALLLSITGCNKPKQVAEPQTPKITVETPEGSEFEAKIVDNASEAPPTEIEIKNEVPHVVIKPQGEIKYDKENDIFDLTDEEIKLYEDYSKNFDKTIFIDVDPKSIFKIWITAGINKAWETEYKLYSEQSVKDAGLTEQVFFDNHMKDISTEKNTTRKEMAEHNFQFLKDAVWKENDKGIGYLEFPAPDRILEDGKTEPVEPITVAFTKNPAGYWELIFYPFEAGLVQ